MNYSLLPYFGSPVTQTIVISDSEYKALRQAEARDQIERIEERIRTYEVAIMKLQKEVGYIKEQVGLPEADTHEQTSEASSASWASYLP